MRAAFGMLMVAAIVWAPDAGDALLFCHPHYGEVVPLYLGHAPAVRGILTSLETPDVFHLLNLMPASSTMIIT